mmetsp:Transcript_29296/g.94420  ORF Transcript_29296/g.94420 Transcript_29296/m.94420 type:complete len:214 (-) Transcript_29296:203-844(-)
MLHGHAVEEFALGLAPEEALQLPLVEMSVGKGAADELDHLQHRLLVLVDDEDVHRVLALERPVAVLGQDGLRVLPEDAPAQADRGRLVAHLQGEERRGSPRVCLVGEACLFEEHEDELGQQRALHLEQLLRCPPSCLLLLAGRLWIIERDVWVSVQIARARRKRLALGRVAGGPSIVLGPLVEVHRMQCCPKILFPLDSVGILGREGHNHTHR